MVQQLVKTAPDLIYPESDGKPLADNTIQFGLIMKIQGGIDALFADDPDVFVAGDLFWYPVEGNLIHQAPDVMVVFGRPKGHRRSYQQWKEGNQPPQVVFEILSKSNTPSEMQEKLRFYERYGAEEYYLYNPKRNRLQIWIKGNDRFSPIVKTEGWVSPRLGVRFETAGGDLDLYRPDGQRFESFIEMSQRAKQEAQRAEQEAQARYGAITRLIQLGLSPEEVAGALGFAMETIRAATVDQSIP